VSHITYALPPVTSVSHRRYSSASRAFSSLTSLGSASDVTSKDQSSIGSIPRARQVDRGWVTCGPPQPMHTTTPVAFLIAFVRTVSDQLRCSSGLEQAKIAEQHANAMDRVAVNGSTLIPGQPRQGSPGAG
jgi:hypothetical protein